MTASWCPPESPHLTCEIEERVLTLTLNRPAMLNAFSYPMLAATLELLQWADTSPDLGAIVVTGAGRAFSSGTDLSDAADGFDAGSGAPRCAGGEADTGFGGIISQQIFRSPLIASPSLRRRLSGPKAMPDPRHARAPAIRLVQPAGTRPASAP